MAVASKPLVAAFWIGLALSSVLGDHVARAGTFGGQGAATSPPSKPIGGSPSAGYRSTYVLKGRTGGTGSARVVGVVVLRGRWNNGYWAELTRTRTDSLGRYQIALILRRHGTLDLRLLTPDGSIFTKSLRVT